MDKTPCWQLASLPNAPQYCCCTPTECSPFFGKPLPSTITVPSGSPRSAAPTADVAPEFDHRPIPPSPINCCTARTALRSLPRSRRTIGSILFRSKSEICPRKIQLRPFALFAKRKQRRVASVIAAQFHRQLFSFMRSQILAGRSPAGWRARIVFCLSLCCFAQFTNQVEFTTGRLSKINVSLALRNVNIVVLAKNA